MMFLMMVLDKIRCPKCGSEDINKNGFVYTTEGQKQRYLCKKCGHIWREN